MGGRSLLTGRDIGVLAAYFPPAFLAIPNLYCVAPDFPLRLRRNIGDRYHFPFQPSGFSTAVRAAGCGDRYLDIICSRGLLRRAAEPEETWPGLRPGDFELALFVLLENGAAPPLRFSCSISAGSCSIIRCWSRII
jgi:hypothetical protein